LEDALAEDTDMTQLLDRSPDTQSFAREGRRKSHATPQGLKSADGSALQLDSGQALTKDKTERDLLIAILKELREIKEIMMEVL